jgi:predicted nicotinamide N-methyase
MAAVLAAPAYWAFCWGSGLALARHIARHPDLVRGRSVVDLGSGCGVVGIAASRLGARRVVACDIDPGARVATRVNAALNRADVDVVSRLEDAGRDHDLLLMADVLYDVANVALLEAASRTAARLLVADSRVTELPLPGFTQLADIEARTFPNLGEFDAFRTVHLFARGL